MWTKVYTRRDGYLERVARVSVNAFMFFGLSLQSKPIRTINFLWNLNKTFVSADFVVIRILPWLLASENDLFAPENFKVLFRHDQLEMAN